MKSSLKTAANTIKARVSTFVFLVFIAFLAASCSKELKAGEPISLIYDKAYLIGDASPAGWTIANAVPMLKGTDPYIFTWTGPLKAGEIKFPTATSFSSDTFAAATQGQTITNNKAQLSASGNPDVKWKLASTDAGTYKITLNTQTLTVDFQKQ
ncbi:SusF/SusE family outer membrane protein [Segetibacter sp.]|jgi:hypothetical protein|uniref:SusF/SusE family outer membrane protein n=1 Tax=Segetibacter sp. TaxID=2231182 RepID=UPI00262F44FF|nr:SusF/SusE family outer membrane protein [Segetibacter sp.]MCW3079724.1 hypothetical protein [Segetibacter sp.]